MNEMFPRVEVETQGGKKVPIHVYGFAHGISVKGTELTKKIANELKREAATFGPNDYVALEGSDDSVLRHAFRKAGMGVKVKVSVNHIKNSLASVIPAIVTKGEHIEHFDLMRSKVTDKNVKMEEAERQIIQEAVHEKQESLPKYTDRTTITVKEMDEFKREVIAELVKRGFQRKDAELHVESKNTFRSLLMARAAYHRAYATGQPVRLFVGFAHSSEIEDFLSNDEKRRKYATALPPTLKRVYDLHESYGWNVVELFEQNAHKFDKKHHAAFFKWLAIESMKGYYNAMHGGASTQAVDINRFRKLLKK